MRDASNSVDAAVRNLILKPEKAIIPQIQVILNSNTGMQSWTCTRCGKAKVILASRMDVLLS